MQEQDLDLDLDLDFPTNADSLTPFALQAALKFRDAVENRCRGTIFPGQAWEGAAAHYTVKCRRGHICHPRANNTNSGRGICDTCRRESSKPVWQSYTDDEIPCESTDTGGQGKPTSRIFVTLWQRDPRCICSFAWSESRKCQYLSYMNTSCLALSWHHDLANGKVCSQTDRYNVNYSGPLALAGTTVLDHETDNNATTGQDWTPWQRFQNTTSKAG